MSDSALNCVTHETTPAKGLVCLFFTFLQSETRGQLIEPFVFVLIGGFKVMCWSYTVYQTTICMLLQFPVTRGQCQKSVEHLVHGLLIDSIKDGNSYHNITF